VITFLKLQRNLIAALLSSRTLNSSSIRSRKTCMRRGMHCSSSVTTPSATQRIIMMPVISRDFSYSVSLLQSALVRSRQALGHPSRILSSPTGEHSEKHFHLNLHVFCTRQMPASFKGCKKVCYINCRDINITLY